LKSDEAIGLLRVLQEPLPVVAEPYARYADKLGISQEQVLSHLQELIAAGTIRRLAGVVRHTRVGYAVNVMLAVKIDEAEESEIDAAGAALASFGFVSHCYRRATLPGWPYALYAMTHSRDQRDFEAKLALVRGKIPQAEILALPSVKEYKKTSFTIG
jgi:DNA-binding Lrp family transcriptional regulator